MVERILGDTTSHMQMCNGDARHKFIAMVENTTQPIVNKFDKEHIWIIPSTTPQ